MLLFLNNQCNVLLPIEYFDCKNEVRTLSISFLNFLYKKMRRIIFKVENGFKRPKHLEYNVFYTIYARKKKI